MPVFAYNYARFSTRKQEDGRSLERQTAAFREACERNGWIPAEQMVDAGVPGSSGQNMRAGMKLTRWVAKVKRGELQGAVLVIEDFDRLSRDFATKAMRTVLDLLDGGITIFTARDGRHGTAWTAESVDGNSGMMTQIADKISAANGYSVRLSWRLLDAWQGKRNKLKEQMADGEHQVMTRVVPHWLGVDTDRKLFIKNREAAIVRQMFRYYSTGYGTTHIARHLNEQSLFRTSGAPWTDVAVLDVLRNRAAVGDLVQPTVGGGTTTANYYPAIVDDELFGKCQLIRTSRMRNSGPKPAKQMNLFTGLVFCGGCGQLLRLATDNRSSLYSRFACRRKKAGMCDFEGMRYNDFEDEVLELLFNRIDVKAIKTGNTTAPSSTPRLEEELSGLIQEQQWIMTKLRTDRQLSSSLEGRLNQLDLIIPKKKKDLENAIPVLDHKAEWLNASNTYWTMFLPGRENVDFRIKLAQELKFIVEKIVIEPQIGKHRPLRISGIGWKEFLLVESEPLRKFNRPVVKILD